MKYSFRGTNPQALRTDIRLAALAVKPKQSVEPSEVLGRELKAMERAVGELVTKFER
jgi:hypothetical protein